MRALVTGAAGFVGANLVRRLLAEGHEVHAVLSASQDAWRLDEVKADIRVAHTDLLDSTALAATFASIRPDCVFHLAAHGAYSHQTDVSRILASNFVSTVNLLEAARSVGFSAFVHTGSSSEYGLKDHAPLEEEWIDPNSDYAVTKAASTLFCRHCAIRHDLPVVTLRLYSVYGPFEEPTRLMPALLVRAFEGGYPPLADPSIARDYVYVEDVCDALLLAAEREDGARGAVYNVGSGVQSTLEDVVGVVREQCSLDTEPIWGSMAARDWDTTVWVSNPARIQEELGWNDSHDLRAGLRAFSAWLKEDSSRVEFYRERLAAGPR